MSSVGGEFVCAIEKCMHARTDVVCVFDRSSCELRARLFGRKVCLVAGVATVVLVCGPATFVASAPPARDHVEAWVCIACRTDFKPWVHAPSMFELSAAHDASISAAHKTQAAMAWVIQRSGERPVVMLRNASPSNSAY